MTLERAIGQATEMLDGFHHYWSESPTSNDRKINGLGWAIIADKWAMLTGRPTSIVAVQEAEARRPGINKLAGKILTLAVDRDAKSA